MRSHIARTVLLALASTSLAACSADIAGNLLAPDLARSAKVKEDTKAKHVHGTLETTESGVPTPGSPIVVRHLEGTGTASYLGRFTVVGDITLNLATATGTGTGSYTAANGDVLTVTSSGSAVLANGIATVTETVMVTGGTGRFLGATGTLTVVRNVVQATGASTGTIDGTIMLSK